jgi:hypothetical protein
MTYTETFASTPASELMPTEIEERVVSVEPEPQLQDLLLNLVALSSYAHQLYTQSHLIHLNVEGPLFLPSTQVSPTELPANPKGAALGAVVA